MSAALKDCFSFSTVEAFSQGDPSWLKQARLRAWAAWEKSFCSAKASGSRFLRSIQEAAAWQLGGQAGLAPVEEGGFQLDEEARRAGVKFMSLEKAAREIPKELEAGLFSLSGTSEGGFASLNAACFKGGVLLRVPAGVELKKTLFLRHLAQDRPGYLPRTLVLLGPGARASLVEEFVSQGPQAAFVSSVVELDLAEDSALSYVFLQDLNLASRLSLRQRARLGNGARLHSLAVSRGAAASSLQLESLLEGQGAHVELLGLGLPGEGQEMEIRTLQRHRGFSGTSDSLVKSILRGDSRFCFDGVVDIDKSGQRAAAFQNNPNLLLSDKARVETIPTLEIKADDVACKHAASMGTLDEAERFYLMSRGVSEKEAEGLIVEGFAADLAQRLPSGELQSAMMETLVRMCQEKKG